MVNEPIQNPGVTPSPRTPGVEPDRPGLGSGEEAQPRPFSLPPEGGQAGTARGAEATEKPSPMDLAREGTKGQKWTPEQMQESAEKIQQNLTDAKNKLQNPDLTKNFTDDHTKALSRLIDQLNPPMRTIASQTGQSPFTPPKQAPGETVLESVVKWIGQGQDTMANSVNYINKMSASGSPDIGGYMKLQFAMNRAQERTSLFTSIISSTVSGIKTLLSTQLG